MTPFHGGQLRQIAARYGVPEDGLLDFSANINPAGAPPAVVPALLQALSRADTLAAYPDLELVETKRFVANYAGTTPENIAVANGFVPLLEATVRTLGLRHTLMAVPCFVEYRPALVRAGVRITARATVTFDRALLEGAHDSILLANPQNPTGLATPLAGLLQLVREAGLRGKTVLLDEAFIDYVPGCSLVPHLTPNVVVFRSVTKFHAIPGLRVAYLASPHAREITASLAPWPVSTLAALAVQAALPDGEYAARTLAENGRRREALREGLAQMGLEPYPSAANFLLFRLPAHVDAGAFYEALIREHRIVLRRCANYEGLSADHFRVAVRGERDNERLLRALRETIAG